MLLARTQPFTGACSRPNRGRVASVRVFASENGSGLAEGTKVKVVKEVKVYHAPKHAEGLDLNGMEGVIAKNVTQYKGKVLSANLPYQVKFDIERDGKPAKLLCHLDEDEIAAI